MENKTLPDDAITQFFNNPEAVTKAIQAGIKAELLKHKQAGNPVCTWRDGKVVWVEADKIPLENENI